MALELNNVGLYFAENYISLQAAINAMPARGGTLILSNKDYTLSQKLVIDKPVTVVGQGAGDNQMNSFVTKIGTTSATLDMIEFAAPNISLKRLGLVNTAATPTTGSGIKVTAGTPTAGEYPSGFTLDQVGIQGFYDNINVVNSYQWSINNFFSYKAVRYGILIDNQVLPDGGDMAISNGWIQAMGRNSEAGIYQAASGGMKMVNIKFNSTPSNTYRLKYGYDGAIAGSSIVIFSGCSFENFDLGAIKIDGYDLVNINGCQFAGYKGTSLDVININNSNGISVQGNVIKLQGSERGIKITNSTNGLLANAIWNAGTGVNHTLTGNTNVVNLNP